MSDALITRADLEDAYGKDEVERFSKLEADAAERALERAQGRVTSRLLTRYARHELPAVVADVSAALRRVIVDLAWYELHKRHSHVSDTVQAIRDDAEAELSDVVQGRASLDLPSSPPVDSTRPLILTSPSRADRLTLSNLELTPEDGA